ncbi:MAG: nitroreductase family protein [Thermoplasmata archaeon]
METWACIRGRVAVRSFTDQEVPEEMVLRVLEAGRWAPSSKNSQPWHFIVVQDRATLQELAHLTQTGPYLAGAPMAIVVAMIGAKFPGTDAGRAIQNMVLAAWEQGLGTCWVANFDQAPTRRLLGLPEDAVVITAFPLGFPTAGAARRGKHRKPLAEIASWERFGQHRPRSEPASTTESL